MNDHRFDKDNEIMRLNAALIAAEARLAAASKEWRVLDERGHPINSPAGPSLVRPDLTRGGFCDTDVIEVRVVGPWTRETE